MYINYPIKIISGFFQHFINDINFLFSCSSPSFALISQMLAINPIHARLKMKYPTNKSQESVNYQLEISLNVVLECVYVCAFPFPSKDDQRETNLFNFVYVYIFDVMYYYRYSKD